MKIENFYRQILKKIEVFMKGEFQELVQYMRETKKIIVPNTIKKELYT